MMMNMHNIVALVLVALLVAAVQPAIAEGKNGFDVSNAPIPVSKILRGGWPVFDFRCVGPALQQ